MGEGERAAAMREAGVRPVELTEKEGLALINGTEGMLGMLVLATHDLRQLVRTADLAAAMSVEALLGTDRVFADDLQRMRPQPGQALSAANMRALLNGSPMVASHRGPEDTRVQDAYSLRCAPQVAGACATRSTTPSGWRRTSWRRRSTTRSSSTTAASRATATSMAR